jgi:protein-disulfide isomerase
VIEIIKIMNFSKKISLIAAVLMVSACNSENSSVEKVFYESASATSSSNSANNSPSLKLSTQNNAQQTGLFSKHETNATTDKHLNQPSLANNTNIAASVGDKIILLNDLDARIELSLFDLEWQKYQLRKQALHALIIQETHANKITDQITTITLIPPTPPRVGLPKDQRPIMGTKNAAVLIDVFCSYQSSHCARLSATITKLEQKYSDLVGFRFFDYPQRFHRYGLSAANAFRCAADDKQDKNKLWAFQSALYADINQLNHNRYRVLAEQLDLNLSEFEACLIDNRHHKSILKDIAFGKDIGLGNVPVVFVNGLYIKGAKPADIYSYYIDQELKKMGHVKRIQASQLPITLLATTVSNIAEQSTAEISLQNNEGVIRVKVGELILPQARIIDIQTNQILINNQGITEFIKIKASLGHQLADTTANNTTNQYLSESPAEYKNNDDEELNEEPQRRTLPVAGEMTLSRDWIDNQLLDQTSLEKHFYNADHIVEGNHLIKLDNVDNQRFYTTLGLKTGDVIMRINDQWVHETQNPLWATLQQNELMTLTVMRKGLPYRYDYRIEED